jgi:capsular exopolysaccharide synthesis family protein
MSETVDLRERQAFPDTAESSQLRYALAKLPKITLPRDPEKPFMANSSTAAPSGLEAYKSLRTRLLKSQTQRGFRTVAVTSASQSDGKTVTSLNLAYCCAQLENVSVLLVDADLRTRGLTTLVGTTPDIGLANVLAGDVTFENAISATDMPRLLFMSAGKTDFSPAELFSGAKWKEFIEWAAKSFSLVIVDSQPSGVVADFELIAGHCDGVLMVVRALRTSREELSEAISIVDPKKLIGVIWNGAEINKKSYYYEPR